MDERLGPILQEVNRLDDLFNTEIVERTLLEEQLLVLKTQGGNAQGASIQSIKLTGPEHFKDKPGSNILQWLDYMECYLTAGQVAEEKKSKLLGLTSSRACPNIGKLLPKRLRLPSKITVCGKISYLGQLPKQL